MFWIFSGKRELRRFKDEVKNSFFSVKDDFEKVGKWITHIDGKSEQTKEEVEGLKENILMMRSEIEELKEAISFLKPGVSKQVFKQHQTPVYEQQGVEVVQTAVQTAVQTGDLLENLTVMERAIVWALLNSDLNLSYEDLGAILGKTKSTIRGQINTIRQKIEGLIEETIEPNGKKRLRIPEEMAEKVLKNVKVRVKKQKNKEKV
jgi:SMC interacting uncharacterized protein involved in chromosome segregation